MHQANFPRKKSHRKNRKAVGSITWDEKKNIQKTSGQGEKLSSAKKAGSQVGEINEKKNLKKVAQKSEATLTGQS